jgi:hypothetical protein
MLRATAVPGGTFLLSQVARVLILPSADAQPYQQVAYGVGGLALLWWAWAAAPHLRNLRYLGSPELAIRVAGNTAAEPFLQRVHVAVETRPHCPVAADARAWALIDEQERRSLRWDTDDGPQESITLWPGEPRYLGLVVLNAEDNGFMLRTKAGYVLLDKDACYLTDDHFIIHGRRDTILAPGREHRLDLSVKYNGQDLITKTVRLMVPQRGTDRIKWSDT